MDSMGQRSKLLPSPPSCTQLGLTQLEDDVAAASSKKLTFSSFKVTERATPTPYGNERFQSLNSEADQIQFSNPTPMQTQTLTQMAEKTFLSPVLKRKHNFLPPLKRGTCAQSAEIDSPPFDHHIIQDLDEGNFVPASSIVRLKNDFRSGAVSAIDWKEDDQNDRFKDNDHDASLQQAKMNCNYDVDVLLLHPFSTRRERESKENDSPHAHNSKNPSKLESSFSSMSDFDENVFEALEQIESLNAKGGKTISTESFFSGQKENSCFSQPQGFETKTNRFTDWLKGLENISREPALIKNVPINNFGPNSRKDVPSNNFGPNSRKAVPSNNFASNSSLKKDSYQRSFAAQNYSFESPFHLNSPTNLAKPSIVAFSGHSSVKAKEKRNSPTHLKNYENVDVRFHSTQQEFHGIRNRVLDDLGGTPSRMSTDPKKDEAFQEHVEVEHRYEISQTCGLETRNGGPSSLSSAEALMFRNDPKIRYPLNGFRAQKSTSNQSISNQDIAHGLIPISEVPHPFRRIFSFSSFNVVQSRVFHDVFQTSDSIVISAPTGSGKTAVFELAIIRMLMEHTEGTAIAVYMAPTRALCNEKYQDWKERFESIFNYVTCHLMTGDTDLDVSSPDFVKHLNPEHGVIIVTTPEKWDMMTRNWRQDERFVTSVRLFMIDEVHHLGDVTRGPTLEAVVSRMKVISKSASVDTETGHVRQSPVRFLAVSATIPNIAGRFHDQVDYFSSKFFTSCV